jgi:hypothetical protein
MTVQIILKNSAVQDKEVTANQVAVGEIALNYHQSGPFLQCKDNSGAVWRLGGVVIDGTEPSSPSKGAWWLDSDTDQLFFYDGSSWQEIQVGDIGASEITQGTARQLLQTNAAGTATEWTSNIDVPGTLDVTGVATFDNNVVITGNLTVNGTTTTIDSTTLRVEDKNVELGVVGSPTDVTADGGGITLKGATDKTLNWVNSSDSWTSSENLDLASGKTYKINGTDVLSATALGSAVQISSANIPSGTIVNDDINASAAIAQSKLNLSITNSEVNASANIAGTKIQAASTSNRGSVQLTNSTSSTSTTTAATPNSVKSANDLASAALPKSGGTMTGDIVFNAGQTIDGYTPRTSSTGAAEIPAGNNSSDRPSPASAGYLRFNTTDTTFEGWDGSAWGPIGGGGGFTVSTTPPSSPNAGDTYWDSEEGLPYIYYDDGVGSPSAQWVPLVPATPPKNALGGGTDQVFFENDRAVTTNYTITDGKNAGSFGPITINAGVTVTIGDGETWTVI